MKNETFTNKLKFALYILKKLAYMFFVKAALAFMEIGSVAVLILVVAAFIVFMFVDPGTVVGAVLWEYIWSVIMAIVGNLIPVLGAAVYGLMGFFWTIVEMLVDKFSKMKKTITTAEEYQVREFVKSYNKECKKSGRASEALKLDIDDYKRWIKFQKGIIAIRAIEKNHYMWGGGLQVGFLIANCNKCEEEIIIHTELYTHYGDAKIRESINEDSYTLPPEDIFIADDPCPFEYGEREVRNIDDINKSRRVMTISITVNNIVIYNKIYDTGNRQFENDDDSLMVSVPSITA